MSLLSLQFFPFHLSSDSFEFHMKTSLFKFEIKSWELRKNVMMRKQSGGEIEVEFTLEKWPAEKNRSVEHDFSSFSWQWRCYFCCRFRSCAHLTCIRSCSLAWVAHWIIYHSDVFSRKKRNRRCDFSCSRTTFPHHVAFVLSPFRFIFFNSRDTLFRSALFSFYWLYHCKQLSV